MLLLPERILPLTLLLLTLEAQANPISDTVIVDDKEWAQVNLFTSLSWSSVDVACPAGVCGANTLNGFDVDGWTWATSADVLALFSGLSGHPGTLGVYSEVASSWAPEIFDALGFDPTNSGPNLRTLEGWTSSKAGAFGVNAFIFDSSGTFNDYSFPDQTASSNSTARSHIGAWLYRDANMVPEPATGLLFGVGIALAVPLRSRARSTKVKKSVMSDGN